MFPFPVTYAPSIAHLTIMGFFTEKQTEINWDSGQTWWISLFVDVSLNIECVHAWGVLKIRREAMVVEGDGVKDVLEHLVGVLVARLDAAVLVIELDGTGNGLEK